MNNKQLSVLCNSLRKYSTSKIPLYNYHNSFTSLLGHSVFAEWADGASFCLPEQISKLNLLINITFRRELTWLFLRSSRFLYRGRWLSGEAECYATTSLLTSFTSWRTTATLLSTPLNPSNTLLSTFLPLLCL